MVEGDEVPRTKNLHRPGLRSALTLEKVSATPECLPPVAEREAWNLQNFFSLLYLLGKKKKVVILEFTNKEPFFDEDLGGWESESLS